MTMPTAPIVNGLGGMLSPVSNASSPIKSILRAKAAAADISTAASRAQLKRKRSDDSDGSVKDEDDNDDDYDKADGGSRSSPLAKRQKMVHFDMSLNVTTEIGGRTLEDTKRSVRKALEAHAAGDDVDYNELMEVFAHDHEPYRDADEEGDDDDEGVRPEERVLYVVALTSFTPLLNKSCVSLVKHILGCSWLGRDTKFFRAYVQFLAALVSAQGAYMRPALEMIVDKFKEPRSVSWTVPDFPKVDRETAQNRLHFALQHLLQLFPAARHVICKLISQKFPYPTDTKSVHLFYLDNLLRLREYAPKLGPDVLETITSHLVKIDTEFQLDLTDMDDELVARVVLELTNKENGGGGNAHHEGNDADDEDGNNDVDSEADDDELPGFGDAEYDEEANRIERSTKLVQKLDAILDRLFALFTPIFEDPDSEGARRCLGDMLSDFANFVLTVPSSRHTQFLIFHFSQKSLGLQDIFTGTLLNLGFESNRPSAVRQAAASYLSSYVARAARVPRETVRSVASILCHRIDLFRRSNSEGCRGPDLRRYQELYAWVQALLYIFCFRWRDLVDGYPDVVDPEDPASFVGQELEWMPGLKPALSGIIYAPFNPLMVCSPPIVGEFAKLAHSLRLMYVFPRIESNKSLHLAQFASGRYGSGDALREDAAATVDDERWLQLEGNFPFDPYHLPVSRRWLEGDYVSWTPIPGVGDGDDDDSDDDSDFEGGLGLDDIFEEDTSTDLEL